MSDQDPATPEAEGELTPPAPQADPKEGYWRRQAEKQKSELEALKRERMSESERHKAERDEAKADAERHKAENKTLRISRALENAAQKAGAHDLDAVAKLADHSRLQVDDNGDVLGVEAALKDLQKNRPYLFGHPPRPSTGSGGGRTTTNGGPDKGSTARRMDDAIRGKLR